MDMELHSITCHPTQVNTLRLNSSQAGRYSLLDLATPEGWNSELSWQLYVQIRDYLHWKHVFARRHVENCLMKDHVEQKVQDFEPRLRRLFVSHCLRAMSVRPTFTHMSDHEQCYRRLSPLLPSNPARPGSSSVWISHGPRSQSNRMSATW